MKIFKSIWAVAVITLVLMAWGMGHAEDKVYNFTFASSPVTGATYVNYVLPGDGGYIIHWPRTKGKYVNVTIDSENIQTGGAGATVSIKCTWSNFNTATAWSAASPYIIWNSLAASGNTGYHKTFDNVGAAFMRFQFSAMTATYVTSYPLRVTFSD
jgi:hypothetical protein